MSSPCTAASPRRDVYDKMKTAVDKVKCLVAATLRVPPPTPFDGFVEQARRVKASSLARRARPSQRASQLCQPAD